MERHFKIINHTWQRFVELYVALMLRQHRDESMVASCDVSWHFSKSLFNPQILVKNWIHGNLLWSRLKMMLRKEIRIMEIILNPFDIKSGWLLMKKCIPSFVYDPITRKFVLFRMLNWKTISIVIALKWC